MIEHVSVRPLSAGSSTILFPFHFLSLIQQQKKREKALFQEGNLMAFYFLFFFNDLLDVISCFRTTD